MITTTQQWRCWRQWQWWLIDDKDAYAADDDDDLDNDVQCIKYTNPVHVHSIRISATLQGLSEEEKLEQLDLDIKCLQLMRGLIHNEVVKLPDDWEANPNSNKRCVCVWGVGGFVCVCVCVCVCLCVCVCYVCKCVCV
jgi:hypothetical protein